MIWFLVINYRINLITFPADRDPAADPWPLELNLKPNCIGSVVRFTLQFPYVSTIQDGGMIIKLITVFTSKQKFDPALWQITKQ